MLQKNCENEIRELSRNQQEMLDEHIDRLNKVFKGKDNYAGIAVMSEKYAPVVRENKEAYPLNEIQVIIKKKTKCWTIQGNKHGQWRANAWSVWRF